MKSEKGTDDHASESDSGFGFGNGNFEIVGQGYWWHLKMGCLCPIGSKFGSTPNEMCNDEKLSTQNNCEDLPYHSTKYVDLPIIRGKKYCAFRDNNYKIMELMRPDKNNQCNSTSKMNKLCGSPTGDPNIQYCIP